MDRPRQPEELHHGHEIQDEHVPLCLCNLVAVKVKSGMANFTGTEAASRKKSSSVEETGNRLVSMVAVAVV